MIARNSFKKIFREVSPNTNFADFDSWLTKHGIVSIEDNSSYRMHYNEQAFDNLKKEIGFDTVTQTENEFPEDLLEQEIFKSPSSKTNNDKLNELAELFNAEVA